MSGATSLPPLGPAVSLPLPLFLSPRSPFLSFPPSFFSPFNNHSSFVWALYGHLWRILRHLTIIELFSSKSLQKSSVIHEEKTRSFLSHLSRVSRSGNSSPTVELKYWFFLLTVNVVMQLVYDKRFVGDEDARTEVGRKLIEGLEEKFLTATPLNLCDYFPVLRWIDYKGWRRV